MTNLDGTSYFYYARHGPLTMLCYWQLHTVFHRRMSHWLHTLWFLRTRVSKLYLERHFFLMWCVRLCGEQFSNETLLNIWTLWQDSWFFFVCLIGKFDTWVFIIAIIFAILCVIHLIVISIFVLCPQKCRTTNFYVRFYA